MSALARITEFLVAPAHSVGDPPVAGPFCAPRADHLASDRAADRASALASVAVIAPRRDLDVVACATALVLAERRGDACAVVCRWAAPGARRAATPRAKRLAERLEARATGRLVLVDLPADAEAAAAEAESLAPGTAVVVAVSVRADAFAGIIASRERVLVASSSGSGPLLRLAVADAARAGRATGLVEVPRLAWAARALVSTGLTVPASLRRAIEHGLDVSA